LTGRLIRIAAGSLGSVSLTRDAVGKIVAAIATFHSCRSFAGSPQQFTYDAAAQLKGATYDSLGRATSHEWRTYTWDAGSQPGFRSAVRPAQQTLATTAARTDFHRVPQRQPQLGA